MSKQLLWYIDTSTSFTYDVESSIIQNKRVNDKWIYELSEICTLLSETGFKYNVDESYNIINVRGK